ncbi:MAG: PAS domain S-box protein [Desulfobacteraceae bacterium]|nr:PAS domain S-box protein [Desulfobacteraceae bacterium]
MGMSETGPIKPVKLRKQTEKLLNKNPSAIKKMSSGDIRNLIEDIQIYQAELEIRNEKLVRFQKELKAAKDRYQALFEDSREARSLTQNGKIVEVNPSWLELHGFKDKSEVIGKDVLNFIHPDDRKTLVQRRKRWPEKMEAVYELRDVQKDGSAVDVEVYSSRISLEGRDAILATIHDITERKQTQYTLQESEERYRTLVDNLSDIVVIIDLEGKITYLNSEFEKVTGYSVQEFVGHHFAEVLVPEHKDSIDGRLNRFLPGEVSCFDDLRLAQKDGKQIPIEIKLTTLLNVSEQLTGIIGIARDISERKKLEARFLEVQKMEAIATLSGGIAHQFNNALSSITGNTWLLEMEFPENQKMMEYINPMKSAAQRMASLTAQLLAYGQGGKYDSQPMSLSDFVACTIPLIEHTIHSSIRLEGNLSPDVLNIVADPTQMRAVISAIVANANEAIEGEGHIRIATTNIDADAGFVNDHPYLKSGPYICLSVEDDGKGMNEEAKSRIFDPFFTTHFMGRGLGMAAVYGIVRNHGGWISVDSEPGKGTVVRVYLPATESEEEAEKKPVTVSEEKLVGGKGTILVIDDEEDVMKITQSALEKLGYRVLTARTGKESVEIAESFEGAIDLAMLDIRLPDMSGVRVYPLIMEARPDLKVIVFSGYSIDGPVQEVLDAGADDFLQKPFSIESMSQKLNEVFEDIKEGGSGLKKGTKDGRHA